MDIFIALIMTVLLTTELASFSVYWNVPTEICYKRNINLSLESYGIIANSNYSINGDYVVIFYGTRFGLYPYYRNYDINEPVNGGLPQNCNLTAHLQAVREDVAKLIPDRNFTGHAVIDLEQWRPLFEELYDEKKVYQIASIDQVRSKNSSLNYTEAKRQAENEFNEAAKAFIVETMKTAKRMRPNAHWSLYGFPYCNYNAGKNHSDYSCSPKFERLNDKMQYIYNESTALYPSIYLEYAASAKQHFRYVQAILMEALRIANEYNPPLPVYPYSKFEYYERQGQDSFYNSSDRCNTIKQSSDVGCDGLIFWSSSANMAERCENIKNYIQTSLGPSTKLIIAQQDQCQKTKNCSATEKCVLKKSSTTPPYPYSTICGSIKSNSTDYDDYECVQ